MFPILQNIQFDESSFRLVYLPRTMGLTSYNILVICFCIMVGFTLDQPVIVAAASVSSSGIEMVEVGVIMEKNSTMEEMVSSCIIMALSDFYDKHAGYRTRLSLHFRDPRKDVVAAASAALDLMENEEVHAIIGPGWSSQAKFVIELGTRAQVLIISFSSTSPSLSPANNQYFVRTAYNDSSQAKAIAAIIQAFGWRQVVLIYEDTEYGNGLIPYIIDAFQEIDVRVPYRSAIAPSSQDKDIREELKNLMMMQTRVFVVHMTASLGSQLFAIANEEDMLNEETVWIVTDGMTSLLDPDVSTAMESMQGVLGVRPHLETSDRLKDLKKKHSIRSADQFNLFALWAYDTVWSLADAVEKAWNPSKSRYIKRRSNPETRARTTLDFSTIGISELGPEIVRHVRNFKVNGVSGNFELVNGQLQPSAFEVFNVVGHNERVIGYWTPKHGLSKVLNDFTRQDQGYSTSADNLKPPLWPGETLEQPKGWVMPVKGKKMRIGVPSKDGFSEFFKIEWDPHTNASLSYSGFSYDVFLAVLDKLPFAIPYEFKPFVNAGSRQSAGTYNDMLYKIYNGDYDMVVGDTAIVANRSNFVDFTLPYSESGVRMVVAIKDDERRDMWIFLKPLNWDLWLTTGMAFVFTGFIVWVLEHRNNEDFGGSRGERLSLSLWFSFSTLVFAHRERVRNNMTRLVLVVWVFVVLIITQSYTASLASFLTVKQLQPKYVDVQDLQRNRHRVGYQKDSFVRDLLIRDLKFDESRLFPYGSTEEYHEALKNGSQNGGVDAIFDDIPCLKLFLAKYCDKYMMVGPTYKTDGFGFAFPQMSPLVSYFSRAVLNVTEDKDKMAAIERKHSLNPSLSCQNSADQGTTISSDNLSLPVYSFGGLFVITAIVSLSALLAELLHSRWRSSSSASGDRDREPLPLVWSKVMGSMGNRSVHNHLVTYLGQTERNRSRVLPWTSPAGIDGDSDAYTARFDAR